MDITGQILSIAGTCIVSAGGKLLFYNHRAFNGVHLHMHTKKAGLFF